jgi:mannosyltransferase OCH1-like enzyme
MLSEGIITAAHGGGRPAEEPSAIPSTIFQFWHGEVVPNDVAKVIDTWRSKSANGPKLVLFSDKLAREFLVANYDASFLRAYTNCHHAAMKSDFIRLCYLFKHGGVYVDVDEECLGEPDKIISFLRFSDLVAPTSTGVPRYFNNNLIATTAGHPVIQIALGEVVPLLQSGEKLNIWNTTGPGLLTKSIVKYAAASRESARRVAAMSDDYLRSLCRPRYSLEYKSRPEGNWRLA